jgi:two-component system LytT family response regulator
MALKCIAIDDEPHALELIKDYILRTPGLQLINTFDDALTGAEYLRGTKVDILFIDIQMPDISGLDLVRSLSEKPIIIFTTAHKKFGYEGFELDAVDYLLKPISFDRFTRAVKKAVEYHTYQNNKNSEQQDSLMVYSEYRLVKIPLTSIEYIESLEDYIKIHLTDKTYILTLMPLKKVLEKLPSTRFKRIHRSYIVAIDKVKSVLNRRVQLQSSKELSISDSYVNFINEWKAH